MFSTHWATNYCPADSGAQLPAKSRYLLVRHSSLEPARLLSSKRDTTCSPHPCSPARTVLSGQCETVSVLSTESVVTSDWNISSALYTADWSGLRSLRPFRGSLRRVGATGVWGVGGGGSAQAAHCVFLLDSTPTAQNIQWKFAAAGFICRFVECEEYSQGFLIENKTKQKKVVGENVIFSWCFQETGEC